MLISNRLHLALHKVNTSMNKYINFRLIVHDMNDFRLFVSNRIKELGLSQNEAALKAGKDGSWLSRFMTGTLKSPTIDSFVGLAKALKIHPTTLFNIYIGSEARDKDLKATVEDLADLYSFDDIFEMTLQVKRKRGDP